MAAAWGVAMRIEVLACVLIVAVTVGIGAAQAEPPETPKPPETTEDTRPPITMTGKGMKPLAGRWVSDDENVELVISEIGRFRERRRITPSVFADVVEGMGICVDGVLKVWVARGKTTIVSFACKQEGDVLQLTNYKGTTVRYRRAREETSPEEEALPPREEVILGEWERDAEDVFWRFQFTKDGRFENAHIVKETQKKGGATGTWRFEGDEIVLHYEPSGKDLRQGFRVAYRDAIEITSSTGSVLRLYRKGADLSPGGPASLPGTWAAEQDGRQVRIELERDGAMVHEQRHAEETVRLVGRYRVVASDLRLYLDGERERWFAFTMRDADTLVLGPGEEFEVALRRMAGSPPPVREGIVGVWVAEDEDVRYEVALAADGTFTNTMRNKQTGGKPVVIRGAYEFGDGMLIARPTGDDPLRFKARLLGPNALELVEPDGEVTVLKRKGAASEEPAPKPVGPGRMAGRWLMQSANLEILVVLRTDGTYEETTKTAQGAKVVKGRYELLEGRIRIYPESGQKKLLRIRLIDDDTLEITDESGNGARLKRQ